MTEAALWVDGRYFIQAEEQIKGTPVKLMKMGEEGVPTTMEYLASLPEGTVIGMDGRTVSAATAMRMEKTLSAKNMTIEEDMDRNLEGSPRPALRAGICAGAGQRWRERGG